MEVNYKRHFSKSYMILAGEVEPEDVLELNVLAYNKVPGLLPVETEVADGAIRFWYDITGKQTLSDYLRRKSIDFSMLDLLFRSLERVCREMTEYLMEEEFLVLEEEHLYLDFQRNHLDFVYLPGKREDIRNAFQKLMENLLQRLDHGDKKAVAVAYEMYQMSLSREMSLSDMLGRAVQAGESKEEYTIYTGSIQSYRPKEPEELPDEIRKEEKKGLAGSAWDPFKMDWKWLKQKLSPKEKKEREEVYMIQEEAGMYHPTEVLRRNQKEQGILMYQGDGNQLDIRINKETFLIGKNEAEVDGYIGTNSVSRMHARIEIEDEAYYIEDLNSTNGTYINGEPLEYRQKKRLNTKDRVTFGMEEYIFL